MRKLIYIILFICLLAHTSCANFFVSDDKVLDLDSISKAGVLRAITMEGASSYYIDAKGDTTGWDYELLNNLTAHLGLDLEIVVARSEQEMMGNLANGEVDIVAYRVAQNKSNVGEFAFVDNGILTQMKLVHRRGDERVRTAFDLIGKEVCVVSGSRYHSALAKLNEEVGGGIIIKAISDTVTIDKLIFMVADGQEKYCVADEDIVRMHLKSLPNLDLSFALSLVQEKSWVVNKGAVELLDTIDVWYKLFSDTKQYRMLKRKLAYHSNYLAINSMSIPKRGVSPYDEIFKKYAQSLDWDWRMLAALSWCESHFNPYAESSVGAKGLMQMMPKTATRYGLTQETIHDPDASIAAGVEYLQYLNRMFRRVDDRDDRVKFMLASYNAGQGHVLDAMALADKYGSNKYLWEDNVEKYLLLKSEEEYYTDSVCKSGYFRANHTVQYIDKVYELYYKYSKK